MQAAFSRLPRRLPLALLASAVVGLAGASVASAATYTVNTTTDNTTCSTSSCSLRGAVIAADTAGGSSTIVVPAGLYKLTIPPTGSDDQTSGDLNITSNAAVTVKGAGSDATTVSAGSISRLFSVEPGASLSLSGLTLRQGDPSADTYPASGSPGYDDGGAIYTDGTLTLTGDVMLQDNHAPNGNYGAGAIYADSASTVSLTGATFENNHGVEGGAIADQSDHALTISRSTFLNNGSASDYGGAIFSNNTDTAPGALMISHSTFTGNTAFEGGAIGWETNSAVSVTNSTFNGNSTNGVGGAIADQSSTGVKLNYDEFVNNSASGLCFIPFFLAARPAQIGPPPEICFGGGGALWADGRSYTLNHDLFKANASAGGDGGAVAWGSGTLDSESSTYVDNSAGSSTYEGIPGGGAIYADSGASLTLINDTMSHNGGTYMAGGGLLVYTSTPAALNNDTITDNVAEGGAGIYGTSDLTTTGYTGPGTAGIQNTVIADNNGGDCDTQFTTFDLGHNMDSDGSCFSTTTQATDRPNTEPRLGNPADNGGPVVGNTTDGTALPILTDAETSSSPTVNHGTNTGCPSTDERGVTRPQGGICDIGAFELAAAKLTVKKTAPSAALLHTTFTYTIKVSNSGPGISSSTTLVDTLPSGETLKGSSGAGCSQKGRTVTCQLGDIAKGSSKTVKIFALATRTGKITNTATAKNAEGSKASGRATTKVGAVKPARARRTPPFTG